MYKKLAKMIIDSGYECYLVGGAIRDTILGRNTSDYDLATNAKPDELDNIFKGFSKSYVGESFKVMIINGVEIATYRKDIYFGGSDKNCKIEYANTIEEDLARRDFTINAMAVNFKTGEFVDIFQGKHDCESRIIDFVGNPLDRINEDPNRIFRAIRFAATIENSSFGVNTYETLKKYARKYFNLIAKERIQKEIMKAMVAKKASVFFCKLKEFNILDLVLPSLDLCYGHDGGPHHSETVFVHNMVCGDTVSTRCPIVKLAGYLHDCGKPYAFNEEDGSFIGHESIGSNIIKRELKDLKFSNDDVKKITNLIRFHMRNYGASDKAARKLLSDFRKNDIYYRDYLRIKIGDRKGNFSKESFTINQIKRMIITLDKIMDPIDRSPFSIRNMEVSGNDVMDILNIGPCKTVGDVLKNLFDKVLDDPELNDRVILINMIKEYK